MEGLVQAKKEAKAQLVAAINSKAPLEIIRALTELFNDAAAELREAQGVASSSAPESFAATPAVLFHPPPHPGPGPSPAPPQGPGPSAPPLPVPDVAAHSSTYFDRPKKVLRITFSFLNMCHVRAETWSKMKELGLWGTIRRTSTSEVKCDIVARPDDAAPFRSLQEWLLHRGTVVRRREDVGENEAAILIPESQPANYESEDPTVVRMIGKRSVYNMAQAIKQQTECGGSPNVVSDAVSTVSSEVSIGLE